MKNNAYILVLVLAVVFYVTMIIDLLTLWDMI